MNDLPEDLARPRHSWSLGEIMGIAIGGGLLVLLVVGITLWAVTLNG